MDDDFRRSYPRSPDSKFVLIDYSKAELLRNAIRILKNDQIINGSKNTNLDLMSLNHTLFETLNQFTYGEPSAKLLLEHLI